MTSVGEWLVSAGLLTSLQVQELLRSAEETVDDFVLAARAVERGWVSAGQLFYALQRIPTAALPVTGPTGDLDPVDPELEDAVRPWGLIPWGPQGEALVFGSFRWGPASLRAALAWLWDRPVHWVLLPADVWRPWARKRWSEWARLEAVGFQVDVFRPWSFSLRQVEGTFWAFQLQESIRLRRPFFTIHQTDAEAWVDYHTPERAVRVLEPAVFEQVWRQAEMSQAWMDLAFFPERSGLWWVDLSQRRLAWLFQLARRGNHRLGWVRLIEPGRWQRSIEEDVQKEDLWEALHRWAVQEAAGVWLLVGPADVIKSWWTVRLIQRLSEQTPFPWVGVHDRWGRWDGLAEIVPTEAFPRWLEEHIDESGGILAEWNGTPQMFQALLLASSRKPVLVSVAYPTPLHAMYRLWYMGFASAIRAGRIRGWLAVVTPRVNCEWCAEPYRLPSARPVVPSFLESELSPADLGAYSRGCSLCQFRAPWQEAEALYEGTALPSEALRSLRAFPDFIQALPSIQRMPLAVQVLEGMRAGRIDARWALRFLANTATWPPGESE